MSEFSERQQVAAQQARAMDELEAIVASIKVLHKQLHVAQMARRTYIRSLHDLGISKAAIARVGGVSRQSVYDALSSENGHGA